MLSNGPRGYGLPLALQRADIGEEYPERVQFGVLKASKYEVNMYCVEAKIPEGYKKFAISHPFQFWGIYLKAFELYLKDREFVTITRLEEPLHDFSEHDISIGGIVKQLDKGTHTG